MLKMQRYDDARTGDFGEGSNNLLFMKRLHQHNVYTLSHSVLFLFFQIDHNY